MNNEHLSTVTVIELSKKEAYHLLNQPSKILIEEADEIQKLNNEPVLPEDETNE